MASIDFIKQGQNVILKKGKNLRLYQVWRKRKVHLDKKHFYLDGVIGKLYGTTWDVHGHNVVLVTQDNEEDDVKEGGTDNRSLVDDQRSQRLRDEDIKTMKSEGKHGEVIIEQLVENSASFKEKTVYSQAKYLKRKRDKHLMRFQILRPSTRLLCEMYSTRAPSKIVQLRIDTMAQILTAANIQSGLNVIVMESCQGLLLGAIMERMAGKGTIVQIHSENLPVRPAADAYNFPPSYKDTLYSFPLHQLDSLESQDPPNDKQPLMDVSKTENDIIQLSGHQHERKQNGSDDQKCAPSQSSENSETQMKQDSTETLHSNKIPQTTAQNEKSSSIADGETSLADCDYSCSVAMETECATPGQKRKIQVNPDREARKQRRRENLSKVREHIDTTKMDALVLACRFQPLPIFTSLFKFLAPSRPFVVYCHYIEPLMECNEWLRNTGDAVNIRVTETWLREYQVLPERTHPHVNMSGTGGYLLTGTTVSNAT